MAVLGHVPDQGSVSSALALAPSSADSISVVLEFRPTRNHLQLLARSVGPLQLLYGQLCVVQ